MKKKISLMLAAALTAGLALTGCAAAKLPIQQIILQALRTRARPR